MTDEKPNEGRASHAGYEPGPVSSDPEAGKAERPGVAEQEPPAADGADKGHHGRPRDDEDDGHS